MRLILKQLVSIIASGYTYDMQERTSLKDRRILGRLVKEFTDFMLGVSDKPLSDDVDVLEKLREQLRELGEERGHGLRL